MPTPTPARRDSITHPHASQIDAHIQHFSPDLPISQQKEQHHGKSIF